MSKDEFEQKAHALKEDILNIQEYFEDLFQEDGVISMMAIEALQEQAKAAIHNLLIKRLNIGENNV
ncbi:MAG: hypothetical protein V4501_11315 [Pseudomonadota bacterium]